MQSRALSLVLTLTVLAPFPAAAAERTLASIEVRQWTAEPSGGILLAGDSLVDTLDLDTDLALQDDDALEGRVRFYPSRKWMVRLGYLPELTLAGDNVVSRSIVFLGRTFGLQSRVVTDLELEYGRFAVAWQGLTLAENRLRIGPIVELKGFRGELGLAAPDLSPPVSEREKFEAAFGSAGLILDFQISDRIELFGEASVTVTGDEGDLTDTELGVRFLPIPLVAIVAGVRTFDVEVLEASDRLDFELDGAFVGASVRF